MSYKYTQIHDQESHSRPQLHIAIHRKMDPIAFFAWWCA